MTQEQYKQFREDFQSIVWYKGQVSSKRKYISTLYLWDKEGSHQKAIEKATEAYKGLKAILLEKLQKYKMTYEEMQLKSEEIAALNRRIKANEKVLAKYVTAPLRLRQTKEKLQKEFIALTI